VARDLSVDPTLTSPAIPLLGAAVAGVLLVAVASLAVRSARHLATAEALRSE
jgi:hypothetical protein